MDLILKPQDYSMWQIWKASFQVLISLCRKVSNLLCCWWVWGTRHTMITWWLVAFNPHWHFLFDACWLHIFPDLSSDIMDIMSCQVKAWSQIWYKLFRCCFISLAMLFYLPFERGNLSHQKGKKKIFIFKNAKRAGVCFVPGRVDLLQVPPSSDERYYFL